MLQTRVIPCLLKHNQALVKTIKFKDFHYIGDPVNTIQIFNNLEVDELVLLDILATKKKDKPDFDLIKKVASECFMPLSYGGGVRSLGDMKRIFSLGVEKIIICSYALENPDFIKKAAAVFGSQSVVVAIDVKKNIWGKYEVYGKSGTEDYKYDPIEFAKLMQDNGAGEILLNSIDCDGTMKGFDLNLIKAVSGVIDIPLIACGGAGEIRDIGLSVKSGASAVALGSLVVYLTQDTNSVLINFPERKEIDQILKK